MTQKELPSVLLHKKEVTYYDTGVSKNALCMYRKKIYRIWKIFEN